MHVLPKFTFIEMISMIGGLIFIVYLAGYVVFNAINQFNLESRLISKLYYRMVENNDKWEDPEKLESDKKLLENMVSEY